jgi:PAS domain S-box-containing protein
MRVLVVDDDEGVRRGVRSLLESHCEVCGEAVDGRDALEKARQLKPDVIVMDVSMPNLNGLEATIAEQNKVQDARGLLAAIVESSDDAIISKTLGGIITSWNKSAGNLFGYSPAEAIGKHITLIVPPDRCSEEADILLRLSRGDKIEHFETVRQRKDGSLVEVSITVSPVKDSEGRIIGASKVARDITERRRTDRALSEQGRLLDLSSDAIFIRDASDRVIYWNRAATELYGFTREEALGRVTHEFLQTEFPASLETIKEELHRNEHWSGELVHIRKDGTTVIVTSRWALDRKAHGNPWCVLETNNDITQQNRTEKALRESEERYRKLSETLDAQVRARTRELEERNADVLRQSEQLRHLSGRLLHLQDEERRHVARELHDSAGQTLTVVGISLAQLGHEAERAAPGVAKKVEEVQDLVQQLHREIRTTSYLLHPPLLDESGLSSALNWYIQGLTERSSLDIKLEIAQEVGRLPSDMELAIFRFVQECLTNVHRHSESASARIRLYVERDLVQVQVTDQGKGMPPERLTEIQSGGSGVGIRGMHERLRQFGGMMKIESSESGTSVLASIPIPKESQPTESMPLEEAV